jgi:hypothetical protein
LTQSLTPLTDISVSKIEAFKAEISWVEASAADHRAYFERERERVDCLTL